jgi:hypothetical protein
MKRMFVSAIISAAILLPMNAQSNNNPNGSVQVASVVIPKTEIPTAIVRSVNTPFNKDNPLTWSVFPANLKDYGWMYEVNNDGNDLTRYEVTINTSDGRDLWATYDAGGNLIETRETVKNVPIPRYVQEALYDSPYRTWQVSSDREIVKYYQGNKGARAFQDFRIIVENGKNVKKLGFKYSASKGRYQAYVVR